MHLRYKEYSSIGSMPGFSTVGHGLRFFDQFTLVKVS
jgi:hypothetical protein